jgi:hypothetical protein
MGRAGKPIAPVLVFPHIQLSGTPEMLIPRVYFPADEDILYHYCDAASFSAICTSKKMRFSDLFSMNDFMEMYWGYHIWEQAASEVIDGVGRDFLDKIDEVIHTSGVYGLILASCYSLDGDVLSQWRAYADDGRGYAIGFRAKDLMDLPVRPLTVLYDAKGQIAEVRDVITDLHTKENSQTEKFGGEFRETCITLSFDLAALKNPAFREEKEIRLIHLLNFEPSSNFQRLVDPGGFSFGKQREGLQVMFRMRSNVPVAFIDYDFTNGGVINPIKEVVVGPANDALLTGISVFLETLGLSSVVVRQSKASYRR